MATESEPLVFENEHLKLYVERADFVKQTRFNLQDHLFHMKISLKNPNAPAPLLRDIFDFLEKAFNFILDQVKDLYDQRDHNIAFLTLFQKPMINGLNTGGFDLQESPLNIVQRVLQMLEQFLISNQTVQLDETFKVYLKVLSVDHMNFKKNQKPRIQKRKKKKHYVIKSNIDSLPCMVIYAQLNMCNCSHKSYTYYLNLIWIDEK